MCVFLPHLAASSLDKHLGYKVASHASGPKVANPPSPRTPLVDTDAPAVQTGQAVATSVKYGAIRHPIAHEATAHDTEVSTWLAEINPGIHQLLCQTSPTALPSQSTETCEVEVQEAGSRLYHG